MIRAHQLSLVASLFAAAWAGAVEIGTSDGLRVGLSPDTGQIERVEVDGMELPIAPGGVGGLVLQLGEASTGGEEIAAFSFDDAAPVWRSAQNANWDTAAAYVTWQPAGGVGDSGHLLLGNGSTAGAGMALAEAIDVRGAGRVAISWQARVATTGTLQILNVRVFDADGADITMRVGEGAYTATSQAVGYWGLALSAPDEWEPFARTFALPPDAETMRVSLRHWTGGDHWLRIDDLAISTGEHIAWGEPFAVSAAPQETEGGILVEATDEARALRASVLYAAQDDRIGARVELQDLSEPLENRAVRARLALPVDLRGWAWHDDAQTSRTIAGGATLLNTRKMSGHDVSLYPLASVTSGTVGLMLAVPISERVAQRFEATGDGIAGVWETMLSPLAVKLGPGSASFSLMMARHGAEWGFREALARYHAMQPKAFARRHVREGAWLYPLSPLPLPEPRDFGFAHFETWPDRWTAEERAQIASLGIGFYYYTEPWLAWQPYGSQSEKPPLAERLAVMEEWARGEGAYAAWTPPRGPDETGHLLIGDGITPGAGMAMKESLPVAPGDVLRIEWTSQVPSVETLLIVNVRLYDEAGDDVTTATPPPGGWGYSGTSQAHFIAGITHAEANEWELMQYIYSINMASPATSARVSVRCWTGGALQARLDDLDIATMPSMGEGVHYTFDEMEPRTWNTAQNWNWEDPGPVWLRVPRPLAAQAVLNSVVRGEDGLPILDFDSYIWHEWSAGTWNQAWPVNPDPDMPSPSTFDLFREHHIRYKLDQTEGVYIDSVTAAGSVGGWLDFAEEHIVLADAPLAFSATGRPAVAAFQAQAEFLDTIAEEIRGGGRLMMLNLFPEASRFHALNGDLLGSETSQLREPDTTSRLRRALAGPKLVSNLLQYNWDREYATHEEMETFFRAQLFFGFYPGISSAGGALSGGTPDRYFNHPELYERDRPLFRRYMPVMRLLGAAGWEPITAARAAGAEIERFGHGARGPVFLTIRARDGGPLATSVTVDLARVGLSSASEIQVEDVMASAVLAPARDGDVLTFVVVLDEGEVGVLRLAPPVDSSWSMR